MIAVRAGFGGMMRNTTWSGICAAVLLAATAALHAQQPSAAQQPAGAQPPTSSSPPATAQAPATPAPPSAATPAATPAGANKITVTGCLQPAPDAPTGTAGAAGAAASTEKFVLTNASSDAANDAAAKAPSAVRSYHLVANEQALSPHTGKKIEVTGTIDSAAPAADGPRLIVESGKIIAPTCTD